MKLTGYINGADEKGFTLYVPFDRLYLLDKREITECTVELSDGRRITPQQRKFIYATFNDISQWSGHLPDEIKQLSKYDFIAKTANKYFSLSDVDMTTANEFLEFLIEFCIEHGIPTSESLLSKSPDISRYLYACLIHKICCICGKKSELHHENSVGIGRNRKEIIHLGMAVLPLCRIHHTECHTIGQVSFNKRYKVYGIKIDKNICEEYKLL